jgi:hypothetical protein
MDETLTCHPLEAPYYGSVMNGWIEPLTCHPLQAPHYDSFMNGWMDEPLTCHPLEAPLLWLSHEWMD